MALVRWDPAREITGLQSEMNRLFNTFFDAPGEQQGATPRWLPAMDLVETEDAFVLRADLPGLTEQDVNLELENNVLTISGERKSEHEERREGYHRVERGYGRFARQLTLPDGVQADGIEARFDNGVLEVRIPKPEERKPRKLNISVGGGAPKTIEGSESAREADRAGERAST